MSDVLGKLGKSLKTTIQEASQQTQKSVDQVGYRTELLNKKNELKKLFEILGKTQYKLFIDKSEDTRATDEICEKITVLRSSMAEIESKLEDIVNAQKNSFDNYKRKVKSTWDDIVNENKQEDMAKDDVEILKICPVCKTGNHEHAAYCIKCGNKFE